MRLSGLVSMVIATSVVLISFDVQAQKNTLTVQAFEDSMKKKDVQVLDVRTDSEYQSGHLANAFLADWTNKKEFYRRVASLDKSRTVLVYCLSGGRSNAATEWLNKNGYTAYSLSGGINAWKNQERPLEAEKNIPQMSIPAYQAAVAANKIVLVDIGAKWCPPCIKMKPVLNDLKKEYGTKFTLLEIDGGAQSGISKWLNVEEMPTFILYNNGKLVWRRSGLVEKKELEEILKANNVNK